MMLDETKRVERRASRQDDLQCQRVIMFHIRTNFDENKYKFFFL